MHWISGVRKALRSGRDLDPARRRGQQRAERTERGAGYPCGPIQAKVLLVRWPQKRSVGVLTPRKGVRVRLAKDDAELQQITEPLRV